MEVIPITVNQYCSKYNKKAKKVIEWIGKGYIPGCMWNNEMWIIPDNARLSYTENRKPQGYSVYKSFVKAYSVGKNVLPSLYSMTPERFCIINSQLIEWGLIVEEKLDNLAYYNTTPKGEEFISFTNSQLNKFIQQSLYSISNGIASGVISK